MLAPIGGPSSQQQPPAHVATTQQPPPPSSSSSSGNVPESSSFTSQPHDPQAQRRRGDSQSPRSYLDAHVVPTLLEGMKLVVTKR